MDSFFVNENDIIDVVNEINNRDANNDWEYEIVDDTLLNLNWSYLGVTFSIELCDDGALIARDDHGNIINGNIEYDDNIYDAIIGIFEYAYRRY